jgi:hypothetical protein
MCFFFSLIPATIWVVLGYFVIFSAAKTQGAVQLFGYILAILTESEKGATTSD